MVTLKAKQKELKASGLGNKPRTSDSLKDEVVEKLFASKCPQVIINTFWPNSTFTSVLAFAATAYWQREGRWGDVRLKQTLDEIEYLLYYEDFASIVIKKSKLHGRGEIKNFSSHDENISTLEGSWREISYLHVSPSRRQWWQKWNLFISYRGNVRHHLVSSSFARRPRKKCARVSHEMAQSQLVLKIAHLANSMNSTPLLEKISNFGVACSAGVFWAGESCLFNYVLTVVTAIFVMTKKD